MQISIIIPVLNELQVIKQNQCHFEKLIEMGAELIFVDGDSSDGTHEYLRATFDQVIQTSAGRANQMNVGAQLACGEKLIFLHVDTLFENPKEAFLELSKPFAWGFYTLRLSGGSQIFRVIERGIRFRSRLLKVATGDQVLVFDRSFFDSLGAFPNLELMEDIAITRLAKKIAQPQRLRSCVVSSSRRWQEHGPLKTCFFMWYIQFLYSLGVTTKTLNRLYRHARWF